MTRHAHHLPFALWCAAAVFLIAAGGAAAIGAAAGWEWGVALTVICGTGAASAWTVRAGIRRRRRERNRAHVRDRFERMPIDDLAMALVCDPCADRDGPCGCTAECGAPACQGGWNTTALAWTPDELAVLRGEKEMPR